MIIKLTNNEWEIIDHRLSLSDAIAEALTDDLDACRTQEVEAEIIYKEVERQVEDLRASIEATKIIDTDSLRHYQREALKDCMEGSTFFADIDDAVFEGEFTKGKALALRKAGYSLERKLNEAGIEGSMCWD
jgi:hypothetical protein